MKNRHGAKGESLVWRPHKDWRVWAAVLLMLAAAIGYVVTLDNAIAP